MIETQEILTLFHSLGKSGDQTHILWDASENVTYSTKQIIYSM